MGFRVKLKDLETSKNSRAFRTSSWDKDMYSGKFSCGVIFVVFADMTLSAKIRHAK
jgi:hypothetical protein